MILVKKKFSREGAKIAQLPAISFLAWLSLCTRIHTTESLMCRHCEEQSDEAICNSLIHWLRDCFASLAMTGYMN